ncbi:DUF262 domain-containing protein [Pedobacter caeni]|uniref:Uncharacterized protein n=1 Tax=Pedobacter caeni TaxID=288992 RepID=A0A1M4TPF9_9SPHI|nr:DUF262 domain-containing protein [Pedobacter caeni]SHE46266.1 Protein of unknown function DUF262 [Pedobacter caeni]
MSNTHTVFTDIQTVEGLLFGEELSIPEYQRPYKWSAKNVNQLIDDILLFSDKSSYRIGTVVIHADGDKRNIVDGQQRIFTLSLIAAELLKTEVGARMGGHKISQLSIAKYNIINTISISNLKQNLWVVKARVKEFNGDQIEFFFQKCELVYIELNDISEAFQFFDSQNSRGRDLAPHDLLKAFHLREMAQVSEKDKIKCVNYWEDISDNLPNIFGNYLFRIRRWSKGKRALAFTKNNISVFKGISVDEEKLFNFEMPYRINHFFTDQYNQDVVRKIDGLKSNFPFQIDQVIVNGKRFFEYVHHYANIIKTIDNSHDEKHFKKSIQKYLGDGDVMAHRIYKDLRTYKDRFRQGDRYVRNLFDCCTLYYLDKFGAVKFEDAIVKFFIWSYAIRLEQQSVYQVTTDNHAISSHGMIRVIREAIHPKEILHKNSDPIEYVGDDKAVKGIEGIYELMELVHIFRS